MLLLMFRVAEDALRRRRRGGSSRSSRGSSSAPSRTPRRYLAGLLRYRGGVVPVVDLGCCWAAAACRDRLDTRIILVDAGRGGAAGLVGLVAEQVNDVRPVDESRRAVAGLEIGGGALPRARSSRPTTGWSSSIEPEQILAEPLARRLCGDGGAAMSEPPGVVERLLAERIGLDPATVGDGPDRPGRPRRGWRRLGLRDRGRLRAGPGRLATTSSRRWSRRSWSPRAGSSATTARSRSSRDLARAGWLVDPARPPLRGPERPLRRGRGAVLDRHHPARRRACRRRGSRSTRWTSAPGRWPGRSPGSTARTRSGASDRAFRDRYFREQRRGVHARPGGPVDRPVPPREPPRPGPARRPAAVRRGLLPEPPDLPRRRRRGPRRSRRSTGSWPTGGLLFLGHADRLDDSTGVAVRAGRRTRGASPTGRRPAATRRGRRAAPRSPRRPRPAGEAGGDGRGTGADVRPKARRPVAGRPRPGPLPRGTEADQAVAATAGGRDPRRSSIEAVDAGRPGAVRRGDRAGRAGASADGGPSARAFFLLGHDPPGGGRPRPGRGVVPQGGLPRRPARRGAARPGAARPASGRRRRRGRLPPPGRARPGAEGGVMSIEPARHGPGRRLLEPDRRQRRPELPRAGRARPLPELPGLRRGGPGFFDRPAPEGYLAEWADLLGRPVEPRRRPTTSALLVFRLGGEWLALALAVVAEVTDAPAGPPGPAPDQPGLLGPGEPPGPVAALRLAPRAARGRPARPGRRARRRTPGWS